MPFSPKRVAVFGASGAIGSAFAQECLDRYGTAKVFCFARSPERIPKHDRIESHAFSLEDLEGLQANAEAIKAVGGLDLIFVATGQLHSATAKPEKTMRSLSIASMEETLHTNTILPAMIMKHFLPLLPKHKKAVFAVISARVGSVSDNYLGGWYSYRASKAALNMLIRCAAIEMQRTHQSSVVIGVHPGTVDSDLSKPFQRNIPEGQMMRPAKSAAMLLDVISKVDQSQTGKCLAYDGTEILP
ncbi:NAD(P)-dependent dehydrogenase, short-chain alcohol dehydrogenase family [Pseudovibrio denitrificans]|uniref:NAD(P)-dependent dehydrogenase, short-chain alcohol dehydrogenase family n=1 Tax=Pseudovibrio denitrificans TaxID=258256 RepID=A0A1I6Y1U4_9HYPH|nr:SDR family NAD(P)-dependent oxidoreductase [Pseudovibrio denitrificans]SFT44353.1 NAD(P)-dependent dehydrogenase, short-chain alcohol dehydrogenase family [Pseudovibrio denitrificans]